MRDTKAMKVARFYDGMNALGFDYQTASQLRRIEMTLQRWAELECGDGNEYASWAIERGEGINLELLNWPNADGNVWLVENRGTTENPLYTPLEEFQTKDVNDPIARRHMRREAAKHVEGKPYMVRHIYGHSNGPDRMIRSRIADREAGALRRLSKIMSNYPHLTFYHQTDPRGCALWILRKSDVVGSIDSCYTRGFGVCF